MVVNDLKEENIKYLLDIVLFVILVYKVKYILQVVNWDIGVFVVFWGNKYVVLGQNFVFIIE